jgi:hypothetical protein
MKMFFSAFALSLLLISCNGEDSSGAPVVKVGNSTLYRYNLDREIPAGLSSADSIIAAEHFIRQWATEALLYDIALKNVKDLDDINRLVEKYRRSLIIYKYQEQLLNERLKGQFDDSVFYAKRNEFLKKTENEIYERAVKRGEIQFYKE